MFFNIFKRKYEHEYSSGYSNNMKNKNDYVCEECKFYKFIDSGYGYCRRYPPKFFELKKFFEYIIVEWDRICCGEFIEKGK